ncbi:FecR domain-containing protein [Pseudomonas sp. Marseille-P9899]|uniref:FecR domain-containing protein n=1 Tax=Pseudomonas sp. Marseille-P9899 TaxID=2730401 RepID=UPI00158E894F|nr:FecR domain-containing protein [Pseudomonas sp. Marseille-P9899]
MTADDKRLALRAAAQWLAQRTGAPDDTELQLAWQKWHTDSPTNRWAWQRVENLQAQLGNLPGAVAYQSLDHAPVTIPQLSRRSVVKSLILIGGVGGLGWSSYRQAPLWLADQRTRVGERRGLQLADGTRLVLNTSTAVDIDFSSQLRLIRLRAGEIQITTGKDSRPFIVRSAEGDIQALGTRFNVRQNNASTAVSVAEHAVQIRLDDGQTQLIEAGQAINISRRNFGPIQASEAGSEEWVEGRLLIDSWPLYRLLNELSRYHSGYLGYSDDVARLLVSGAFPLDDIAAALAAVARALPVTVVQRTRFWTRVIKKV